MMNEIRKYLYLLCRKVWFVVMGFGGWGYRLHMVFFGNFFMFLNFYN